MRYLKLYELKLQKTFVDWLKNPENPTNQHIVSSSIRKRWKLSNINAPLLDLDKFTQKQCGIGIINSIGVDMDLDRDSVLANEKEVFAAWIDQEWGGLNNKEKFLNTYGLDFIEYKFSKEDFINIKSSIDSAHLENSFDYRSFGENFKIVSIKFYGIKDNKLELLITTDRVIDGDDKGSIKDFLTGQLSDGWGDIYSKKKQIEKIGKLTFETSIDFYWSGGYPTWDIEMD